MVDYKPIVKFKNEVEFDTNTVHVFAIFDMNSIVIRIHSFMVILILPICLIQ